MSGEHSDESLIKTPKQLVTVVVLGFLVPVLLAALGAYLVVTGSKRAEKGDASLDPAAVAARIKPVAEVAIGEASGGAGKAARSGEEVVQQYCAACHATGAAGAPKIGDKGAWSKHLGGGLEHMLHTAIAGKGSMPARGGASDLSDYELARAIVYMANKSGGSSANPPRPRGRHQPPHRQEMPSAAASRWCRRHACAVTIRARAARPGSRQDGMGAAHFAGRRSGDPLGHTRARRHARPRRPGRSDRQGSHERDPVHVRPRRDRAGTEGGTSFREERGDEIAARGLAANGAPGAPFCFPTSA